MRSFADCRNWTPFDAFFTDLYDGAEAMGIPAQAAISEAGLGSSRST